jgi:3',5'-cyclic AMP phosphodiesterase CpdA
MWYKGNQPGGNLSLKLLIFSFTAFCIFSCALYAQSSANPEIAPLVFISDTQSPLWFEKLFLDYHDNENARSVLFDDILRQKPAAILHLGDLVGLGFKANQWEAIDGFLQRLTQAGIPFFPALGNHELYTFPVEGEKNFMARFPDFIKTGYTRRFAQTAVILLNSNFDHLPDALIQKQQQWYENELNVLSRDTTIAHIIVGCHHSPFTNSAIVSDAQEVQNLFVDLFKRYPKCHLFISGHAHRFEHFQFFGKDFIVTGGGGGLQHPERRKTEAIYHDLSESAEGLRPFHYVQIFPGSSLKVAVRMLNADQKLIGDGYSAVIENDSENLVSGRKP